MFKITPQLNTLLWCSLFFLWSCGSSGEEVQIPKKADETKTEAAAKPQPKASAGNASLETSMKGACQKINIQKLGQKLSPDVKINLKATSNVREVKKNDKTTTLSDCTYYWNADKKINTFKVYMEENEYSRGALGWYAKNGITFKINDKRKAIKSFKPVVSDKLKSSQIFWSAQDKVLMWMNEGGYILGIYFSNGGKVAKSQDDFMQIAQYINNQVNK